MAVFNEPTKWAQSLGATANADVIPDEAGAMDVDISKIFPAVFSIPLAQGGKAIPRRTLNGLLKLLGDWLYYYQQGGVASYSTTVDYVAGRVVLYTDGNLYKCIQANGADNPQTPTDGLYWAKVLTPADIVDKIIPTSTILPFAGSTVPNGWLLCNGAGVSRVTFSALFAKIGTTFGDGDGSTTFNVPDLRDRYIIGANANALGAYIAEQLPNITGATAHYYRTEDYEQGALYQIAKGERYLGGNSQTYICGIAIDASRSNSVYTNNGKVYPASIALNFIIKT